MKYLAYLFLSFVVSSQASAQSGWKQLSVGVDIDDMSFSSSNQGYLLYSLYGDTSSYISNDFDSVIHNSVLISGKPNPNYNLGEYPSSIWSLSDTSAITLGYSIYRRTFSSWANTTSDRGISWEYLNNVSNLGAGMGLKMLKINDTAFFLLTGDKYDDNKWHKRGALYRTKAIGEDWQGKLWVQNGEQSFKDIIFIDSVIGLCIGDSIIFITTDLGDTWDTLSIQLNDGRKVTPAQSIANVKGTSRLLAGSKYGMIASDDKGKSWYVSDSSILMITAISFFDSSVGYCAISSGKIHDTVDQQSTILKTLDGGHTWFKQYVSSNDYNVYRKFIIASRQRAYALTLHGGGNLYTYDGGGPPLSVNAKRNSQYESPYLICYPNPANKEIEVSCPLNEGDPVYIYDDLGRVVLKQDRYLSTVSISTINIKSGHYTIRIGQKYGRFILIH